MEYFDKPHPALLQKLVNQQTNQPIPDQDFAFDDFLAQLVWVLPVWRSNKDYVEAYRRLRPAIEKADKGQEIECRPSDHEKLLGELQKLQLAPHLVDAGSEFVYALMCTRQQPRATTSTEALCS